MTSQKRRRLTLPGFAVAALALLVALAATAGASGEPTAHAQKAAGGTVAFLLPDNTTPRWTTQDAPLFEQWMKKYSPGTKVIVSVANEDPQTQLSQAKAALTKGAKVLVVVAVDGAQAAKIVQAASEQNVPVIAYTRQITNAPVKYMTGDDPHEIGVILGRWVKAHTKKGDTIAVIAGSPADSFAHLEYSGYMGVLRPLFKSGARKLVGDVWTPEWDPVKAHAEMDAILTKTQGNVQAVLSANDGMAAGIIGSLQAHHLAGKIPVTGIDATLASDQLILRGLQSMTVWRSISIEAQDTARLVSNLLKGKATPKKFFTGTVNNGYGKIPFKGVKSFVIDKHNMQRLIAAKVVTKAELCKGISKGTGPC